MSHLLPLFSVRYCLFGNFTEYSDRCRCREPHTLIIHVNPGNGKLTLLLKHHNYTRLLLKTPAAFRAIKTTHDYHFIHVDSRNGKLMLLSEHQTTHNHYSRRSRKRKTHATFRTSQLHTIIIHVDLENGKLTLLSEHHNHTRS